MNRIKKILYKIIPHTILDKILPFYHKSLAFLGAVRYFFPSKDLYVIAVTGTKGKTTTTEIINTLLEEAGYKTALSNGIRFKIGDTEEKNMTKMSMPGRFFMHSFLSRAKKAGCTHVIIEMTSEGARLFRHSHIFLDAFIFTNLSPEHIERHGSFEKYRDAKMRIKDSLLRSPKKNKVIIANKDDVHSSLFMESKEDIIKIAYSLKNAEPYSSNTRVSLFTFCGVSIHSPLLGTFNISNMLAGAYLAKHLGIDVSTIKNALEKLLFVKGRAQKIDCGQPYLAIVDYAHTAESLEALYKTFPHERKICVLGSCGGGRDKWKRPQMAGIAEKYCDDIIFTNEDPYDEKVEDIIQDLKSGLKEKEATIILDRRKAISYALKKARERSVVLITGKGTDPYIMGENGSKIPWSDEEVVKEEIKKIQKEKSEEKKD
jgi:UDP-N-acetylmuramoyl-L-alanyl-D-glutamate--2,6-diaminopimelate ligase